MKVAATRNETPPKFEPVTLSITLETLDEAAAMFAIFNVNTTCEVSRQAGISPSQIRDAIANQVSGARERGNHWHARLT